MFHQRMILTGSMLALFWLAAPAFAEDEERKGDAFYITFEINPFGLPPFAAGGEPVAINTSLTVVGDTQSALEPVAFVRELSGKITGFGVPFCTRVFATGINAAGAAVGFCQPLGGGWVRDPQGTTTTFNCPAASFTTAYSINAAGAISGSCGDAVAHGFVRSPQGTITEFDPPGSVTVSAYSINDEGAIAGVFTDVNRVQHGFVRNPNGAFTVFDLPGAFDALGRFGSIIPFGMNNAGTIAGTYRDSTGLYHGFVRSRQGAITTFDIPGSTQTFVYGINARGTTTGVYINAGGGSHSYVRTRKGSVTSFDVPNGIGTVAKAINDSGAVTGYFRSATTGPTQGFIRVPSEGSEDEREDERED